MTTWGQGFMVLCAPGAVEKWEILSTLILGAYIHD